MVQGNFNIHEYFIDCGIVSQSLGRAIFGAWLIFCVAVIAICIRSVYHSKIKNRLLTKGGYTGAVSLWAVSPATTPFEVLELRSVLIKSLTKGELFFFFASLACVVAAVLSAASTLIANRTVVSNVVVRTALVPGLLSQRSWFSTQAPIVELVSRIDALDKANAPLEELFDFVPFDGSGWLYMAEQWNNSWHGQCSYYLYPAVDLVVLPSDSPAVVDRVPSLLNWLPQWVAANDTSQGSDFSGYLGVDGNNTGSFQDLIVTYIFRNPVDIRTATNTGPSVPAANVSLVNFLVHHVGRDGQGHFVPTSIRSDVHVVDCAWENADPNLVDQARAGGEIQNAAQNVAKVYGRHVRDASISGQPVVQPTAQQMLRYWQAYMSIKDTGNQHSVERYISVSRPVVQIRLSVLVSTTGTFLLAICIALLFRVSEPRDMDGKRLDLPSSPLAWMVEAARDHDQYGGPITKVSPSAYADQHHELMFALSLTPDGQSTAFIATPAEGEQSWFIAAPTEADPSWQTVSPGGAKETP